MTNISVKKIATLVSVLSLAIMAALLFFRALNSNMNLDPETKPELEVSAETMLSVLKGKESALKDSLRIDQVVEIAGLVNETNTLNQRITVLLKGSSNNPPFIICDMQPNQKEMVLKLKPDDTVRIKGVYKGFLHDAILLECIITYPRVHD